MTLEQIKLKIGERIFNYWTIDFVNSSLSYECKKSILTKAINLLESEQRDGILKENFYKYEIELLKYLNK